MVVINQDTNEMLDVPHALAPHLKEGDAFSVRSETSIDQTQLRRSQGETRAT